VAQFYIRARAVFTQKPKYLRNQVQKLCIFLTGGAYAPYAPCMSTPLTLGLS